MKDTSDDEPPQFDPEESLISKKELAWRLGKSERTIDNWRRNFGLPCLKVRRSVFFRHNEVVRHLEKCAGSLPGGWVPPRNGKAR